MTNTRQFKTAVQFEGNDSPEQVAFKLNRVKRDLERTASNSQGEVTVLSGGASAGSSSSGGGGASVIVLAGFFTATAGANTIPLPGGGFTPLTIGYTVWAQLVATDTSFGSMPLGQPNTKATTSFTFDDIPVAGVIYFHVVKNT
jgi:hypothetical protein